MTYINFERQGMPIFESFTVVREKRLVNNRNLAGLEIPHGIFGFYFYDEEMPGKYTNMSSWHYVGGQVFQKDGVKYVKFNNGCVTSTFSLHENDILLPAT